MKYPLKNKTVIISGASGHIGSALTCILVKKYGCTVYGIDKDKEQMQRLIRSLGENASRFIPIYMDITSKDYSSLDGIESADILINNAGAMPPFTATLEESERVYRDIMEINFFSQVALTERLLPIITQSKHPAIFFVSSAIALCPTVGTSAYSASKSAIKAYSEILATERTGIYVATIFPGITRSTLFSGVSFEKGVYRTYSSTPEKTAKRICKGIAKRKARIITGMDGNLMNFIYKVMPVLAPKIIRSMLKNSGYDQFKKT
jgi:short-subunit dehydrogenase